MERDGRERGGVAWKKRTTKSVLVLKMLSSSDLGGLAALAGCSWSVWHFGDLAWPTPVRIVNDLLFGDTSRASLHAHKAHAHKVILYLALSSPFCKA